MARAHSCAVPAASVAHPVFNLPQSLAHRRAASTPEALPDFLLAASMPAELSRMEDADGMTGESPSPTRISRTAEPCMVCQQRAGSPASWM